MAGVLRRQLALETLRDRIQIRVRLLEHLAGRQSPGRGKAKLFSYEVTRYSASRERALLEEHRRRTWSWPEHNLPA